jgi:hypothetical protein
MQQRSHIVSYLVNAFVRFFAAGVVVEVMDLSVFRARTCVEKFVEYGVSLVSVSQKIADNNHFIFAVGQGVEIEGIQ